MDPITEPRTEEARQKLWQAGFDSLFFFAKCLLGFDRLGPLQHELCDFLQGIGRHGPWKRALVCAYRGALKSSCTTQAWPVWMSLYCFELAKRFPEQWGHLDEGWCCKIIENSSNNAKVNHFLPMIAMFREGPRAEFLQWLYRERIPANFDGWNSEQIPFIQGSPLKKPSITYWGLESAFEGWHGNAVILDDPEGADAEKSDIPNAASMRAYQAAIPLLEEQKHDQILAVGTPHGDNPFVYRILENRADRDEDGNVVYDNDRRSIKVFWIPALKRDGTAQEPHRFGPEEIARLQATPDVWDQQFMLRRRRSSSAIFLSSAIQRFRMEWVDPRTIRYLGTMIDPDDVDPETGIVKPRLEWTTVRVDQLRHYVHVDPTHRLESQMKGKARSDRPSRAAIVVVGVAPDGHVFPRYLWLRDAGVEELAKEAIRLFRAFNAHQMTFEAIGAQVWFRQYLETIEQNQRRIIANMVMRGEAAQSSLRVSVASRLFEANKTNQSKEWVYRESLAPWINHGVLHLDLVKHQELVSALLNVTSDEQELDLIDALAQGPDVWQPPVDSRAADRAARARRLFIEAHVRQKRSGFVSPYRSPGRAAL